MMIIKRSLNLLLVDCYNSVEFENRSRNLLQLRLYRFARAVLCFVFLSIATGFQTAIIVFNSLD